MDTTIQEAIDGVVATAKQHLNYYPKSTYFCKTYYPQSSFEPALIARLRLEGFKCKYDIIRGCVRVRNSRTDRYKKLLKNYIKRLTKRYRRFTWKK